MLMRIYAYGDPDEDREMLAIAHEQYYRTLTLSS
jgi:phosphoserine phosphatase